MSEVEPDLAATWRVSDDQRLYTLVLDQDRTFSDGTPVDAWAVARSFRRAHKMGAGHGLFGVVTGLEILGPSTLRLELREPLAYLPQLLAGGASSIVREKDGPAGPGVSEAGVAGSGSYRVAEKVTGENGCPDRHGEDIGYKPRLDRVEFIIEPNQTSRLALVRQGRAQIAAGLDDGPLPAGVRTTSVTRPGLGFAALNCRRPWLESVLVRRALSQAVNYDELIALAHHGRARRAPGAVPQGVWGGWEGRWAHEYQPAAAEEAIEALDRPDTPLAMVFDPQSPSRNREARLLKSYFEEIGLTVELRPAEGLVLDRLIRAGDFDIFLGYREADPPVAELLLESWVNPEHATARANAAHYANAEAERLLSEARRVPDSQKRLNLLRQVQDLVLADCPYIFLYQPETTYVLSDQVEELELDPVSPDVLPLTSLKWHEY